MRKVFILPAALFIYTAAFSQAGTLDNTFSGDGKVITGFLHGDDYGHSVAIQADGKIVVVGTIDNGTNDDFGLVRYNANGTRDNTFGGDGRVNTDFGAFDGANAVAIQSTGKIVVAGYSGNNFAIARYNTNGMLDNTFGGDGKVITNFGGNDGARSIAVRNGKIIAAGSTTGSGGDFDFAIARYNGNGTLDNTFGGDGKVVTEFGATDESFAVAIQGDDKIVVAGYTNLILANNDFAIARYNTNGTLDDTFGGNGKLITAFGGNDVGRRWRFSQTKRSL